MTGPRIGSLFSGYGGLDMGVIAALGGSVAWHVEFDEAPSKILAYHWPEVPNYGDITKVDWSTVAPIDILTGGFPCQDVSLAGARKGLKDGTRSGLWAEFARAINYLQPKLVVIENVRGLLSATAGDSKEWTDEEISEMESGYWYMGEPGGGNRPILRALGAVLGDLASLGYDASWHGIRAADAGAPHGRFRVFILAYPQGQPWRIGHGNDVRARGGTIGLGATTGASSNANSTGSRRTEGENPGTGGGNEGARVWSQESKRGGRESATPNSEHKLWERPRDSRGRWTKFANGALGNPNNEGLEGWRLSGKRPYKRCVRSDDLGDITWGRYAPAIRRWEERIGRVAPAPTKDSKGGHRLSPEFVEWMMGLPAGHVTSPNIGLTRNQQLRACGNGVVPQQAELAIRYLLSTLH